MTKIYPKIKINHTNGYHSWYYYFYESETSSATNLSSKSYGCFPSSQAHLDHEIKSQFDIFYQTEKSKANDLNSSYEVICTFKFKPYIDKETIDEIFNIKI